MLYVLKQVGGSFLRTAGRFIFYILIGAIIAVLLGSCEVKAAVMEWHWGTNEEIIHPISYNGYNCSSSGCSSVSTAAIDLFDGNGLIAAGPAYTNVNTINTSSSYLSQFTLDTEAIRNGYMYSFKAYICDRSTVPILNGIYIGSGANIQSGTSNLTSYFDYVTELNGYPGLDPEDEYFTDILSCRMFTKIFVANVNSNLMGVKTSSNTTANRFYFIGYSLENLGNSNLLTVSDMNSIIANSGLATASSVSEVNDSISTMKEEITKAQEETNKKLDEVNDSITNDEVDSSSASGFFDNFSTEDNGGLSSVVTSPLRFIQKLTNTCEPLEIPLFGETISFPCGDEIFWNREDVQTFRTTWNILFGGGIIYMLMTKLFKVIENLKNPENSKVEVMKL